MDFVADPGVFNVKFVLKLIDNTLADIAEGSDVVEKDFHPDHVFPRLSFMFFYAFKWLCTNRVWAFFFNFSRIPIYVFCQVV